MLPWKMTLAFNLSFTGAWADMMTGATEDGASAEAATDAAESRFARLDHAAGGIARAAHDTAIRRPDPAGPRRPGSLRP
ncbi:hypothetical protein [Wenxinia marina]|nr:hypothetical protein [Wenxinia marina]